jgi:co-chaperonin GroES (HSP10)
MEINNSSGLTPVGISLLVLPNQVEQTTDSGIVLMTDQELSRHEMKQTDVVVIAIGPQAFDDEPQPRCKVGDRVITAAYAGILREGNDGVKYRIIRDHDVIALLEEKEDK